CSPGSSAVGSLARRYEYRGKALDAALIGRVKSGQPRAVDVEYAQQGVTLDQGNDYLRPGGRIAGDVARKLVHITDDHGFASCRVRTADTLPERNSHAGRFALEGAHHELTCGLRAARAQEIESDPVDPGQGIEQERRGVGRIGDQILLARQQTLELISQAR